MLSPQKYGQQAYIIVQQKKIQAAGLITKASPFSHKYNLAR
jgi:hypothetical protein